MTREEFINKWNVAPFDGENEGMLSNALDMINCAIGSKDYNIKHLALLEVWLYLHDMRQIVRAEERAQEQAYEADAHRAFYHNEQ